MPGGEGGGRLAGHHFTGSEKGESQLQCLNSHLHALHRNLRGQ